MIKKLYTVLVLVVSLTVLSAWTFRMNRPSLFRGGDTTTMLEEFHAYGLSKNTMIFVGVCKVIAAIALLLGLKFQKLVVPAAAVMAGFMCAAIYFHLSISDPIVPTAPSTIMMLSCLGIIFMQKKLSRA
jgi:uncharacterized membrane protein YphA (DoxX/SURF4 family)